MISAADFKQLAKVDKFANPKLRKDYPSVTEQLLERKLRFVISTNDVDRENDRVNQDGWQLTNYLSNPVVLFSHDSGSLPIGRCIDLGVVDGKLLATVEFVPADMPVVGPLADAVYRMCRDGFMSATSVGFRPLVWEWSDDEARPDGVDYLVAELAEFSIVAVPANPFALIVPQAAAEPSAAPSDAGKIAAALNTKTTNTRRRWRDLTRLYALQHLNEGHS